MDLKLTTTSLEIAHGTHKEIIEVLEALQTILPNNPFVQKDKAPKVNFNETVDKVVSNNIPRKRLVFDTCEECESTLFQIVEISDSDLGVLAPLVHCRCGHSQPASNLTKGKYTCDCGFEGYFWMTPNVNRIKCKSCGQFHVMIKNADTGEYENYR